jgi:hypothetical protein
LQYATNTRNVPLNLIQGLFKISFLKERKAPGQALQRSRRCDGQEEQCVKAISVVMEWSKKKPFLKKMKKG